MVRNSIKSRQNPLKYRVFPLKLVSASLFSSYFSAKNFCFFFCPIHCNILSYVQLIVISDSYFAYFATILLIYWRIRIYPSVGSVCVHEKNCFQFREQASISVSKTQLFWRFFKFSQLNITLLEFFSSTVAAFHESFSKSYLEQLCCRKPLRDYLCKKELRSIRYLGNFVIRKPCKA